MVARRTKSLGTTFSFCARVRPNPVTSYLRDVHPQNIVHRVGKPAADLVRAGTLVLPRHALLSGRYRHFVQLRAGFEGRGLNLPNSKLIH